MCDRFAAEGFVALAPDLYHGETTTEPDEAGKLMMALNLDQAATDMSGAIAYLQAHEAIASRRSSASPASAWAAGWPWCWRPSGPTPSSICVPWYGLIPWEHAQPDWSNVQAKVRGHFAEQDGFFGPDKAQQLEDDLQAAGVDAAGPHLPRRRPRLLQRHPARGPRRRRVGRRRGTHCIANLHAELG